MKKLLNHFTKKKTVKINKKTKMTSFILSVLITLSSSTFVFGAADWKEQKELYDAILKDDVATIETILAKHPKFAKIKIKYHNYPIFDATTKGSVKALKLLVEKGADIKQKDSQGNTILHAIAENFRINIKKREALLEYLIKDQKLKIDVKNKAGETPFVYAFITQVSLPPVKNCTDIIDAFDKYKAKLNAQDKEGRTVLNSLVKNFRIDKDPAKTNMERGLGTAKYLIEKGVNINLPDKEKRTPLVTFLVHTKKVPESLRVDFVTFMMENGANIKLKSKKREKALKLVEKKGELYKVMKKKYKKKAKKR